MDEEFASPPPGKYPYRFTQDDRFQYRVKVQPAGDCLEFTVRASDTRLAASADYRSFHGIGRNPRFHPADDADRDDSIRRSVERSKRMVRLAALQIRADRLVTFTTRGVYDRPTLVVIWDRFLRLVRRVCPGFLYVAVPEPHKETRNTSTSMRLSMVGSTLRCYVAAGTRPFCPSMLVLALDLWPPLLGARGGLSG